jgi:hypothetical protein
MSFFRNTSRFRYSKYPVFADESGIVVSSIIIGQAHSFVSSDNHKRNTEKSDFRGLFTGRTYAGRLW